MGIQAIMKCFLRQKKIDHFVFNLVKLKANYWQVLPASCRVQKTLHAHFLKPDGRKVLDVNSKYYKWQLYFFYLQEWVQNIHPYHHYLHLSSFYLLIQLPSSLTSCAHQVLVKTPVSRNFVQVPAINQLHIQMNSISIWWSFKQGISKVT